MSLFSPDRLLLIAGPCALESQSIVQTVAGELARLQQIHPELQIVFKGSFDKANRTSLQGPRGPGLALGLEWLAEVGRGFGFPLLTDIHACEQASPVASTCQILQIPAFLCRQTDLLLAAAATGKVVNVKKGQFLSPHDMAFAVAKLEQGGAAEIWLTERGTTFGYRDLVVDMRAIPIMREFGHPVIFDATHSVQSPGAGGGQTGGDRRHVPHLVRSALAAGADGLFIETHPDPDKAISDAANQMPLSAMPELMASALRIWRATRQ